MYIIDVSQSVEHDHPAAFDFLRSDIKNVDDFWARRGARTLGLRKTFEFVVADKVLMADGEETEGALRERLTLLIETRQGTGEEEEVNDEVEGDLPKKESTIPLAALSHADIQRLEEERAARGTDVNEQLEDAVFMRSYIPRNLNDVFDPERDAAKVRRGEGDELIYGAITGVVEANPTRVEEEEDEDGGDSSEDDDEEDEDEDADGEKTDKKAPRGHRHEDKDAKKVRFLSCLADFLAVRLFADLRAVLVHIGEETSCERRGEGETKTKDTQGREEKEDQANGKALRLITFDQF